MFFYCLIGHYVVFISEILSTLFMSQIFILRDQTQGEIFKVLPLATIVHLQPQDVLYLYLGRRTSDILIVGPFKCIWEGEKDGRADF